MASPTIGLDGLPRRCRLPEPVSWMHCGLSLEADHDRSHLPWRERLQNNRRRNDLEQVGQGLTCMLERFGRWRGKQVVIEQPQPDVQRTEGHRRVIAEAVPDCLS